MKIIVTGSLGHIGSPLTKMLVAQGHAVTVISSKPEKQKDIEALGAVAAIGSLENPEFLRATFTGNDAVYLMNPPNHLEMNQVAYYRRIAGNYAQAIEQTGVKRAVYLSSYGADLDKGTGLILGSHHAEGILNELSGLNLTHMRPTYFYYNLYSFLDMIKAAGFISANYGAEDKIVMVSPIDIAAAIAQELVMTTAGERVRYVASDERTGNEIASILGAAIGKPDLKWTLISDAQRQSNLESYGVSVPFATNLVEMFSSLHNGALSEDYYRHKPAVLGEVKLEDFAKEFAATFNKA
jgi:uncharacterized protein YbjT (DUF2867 family)